MSYLINGDKVGDLCLFTAYELLIFNLDFDQLSCLICREGIARANEQQSRIIQLASKAK